MSVSACLSGPRCEIPQGDPAYPQVFLQVSKPPQFLYVLGNPAVLSEGLAIVGARKATPYGRGCAKRFAGIAAAEGVVVISGGARGCDAAAHEGALSSGGSTLAFLGSGANVVYPAENRRLFQRIISEGGALVSEHPWDTEPRPWMFRARNRLIASLARATLIVEAGLPSGTFSTADEALAASRDVLVVPGAITSASSQGANRLLLQGAAPVVDDESFRDVLFTLFGTMRHPAPAKETKGKEARGKKTKGKGSDNPDAFQREGENEEAPLFGKELDDPDSFQRQGEYGGLAPPRKGSDDSGAFQGQGEYEELTLPRKGQGKPDAFQGPKTETEVRQKEASESDPLIEALRAQAMHPDDLMEIAKKLCGTWDVRSWLAMRLTQAEATGLIARFPDGTWGPVG